MVRRRKLIPAAGMIPVAANILGGIVRQGVRKYGIKALSAGVAGAAAYGGARQYKYTTKPKVKREKVVQAIKTQPYKKKNITKKKMSYRRSMNFPTKSRAMVTDNQRKYATFSSGKKLTTSALVDKTVKASLQRCVFFFRRYTQEATGGSFQYGLDSSVGGSTRYFPLYLFDLTARPQYVNGVLKQATCGLRAICDTTGVNDGKIRWQTINGNDKDNVSNAYVQFDEGTSLSQIQSSGKSLINWFDIKAQVQGARNIPTKVTFEIIKLLDDELDPVDGNGSTTTNGITSTQHQQYWQSEIAQLTYSPIHTFQKPKKRYVKIISSKSFTFQPKESVDNDTRGQLYVLKWFNRINKIVNYNNSGTVLADDNDFVNGKIPTNPSGQAVSPYADASDKYYLRVKAYSGISLTSFDPTVHPSFELNLRMCHSTLV